MVTPFLLRPSVVPDEDVCTGVCLAREREHSYFALFPINDIPYSWPANVRCREPGHMLGFRAIQASLLLLHYHYSRRSKGQTSSRDELLTGCDAWWWLVLHVL